MHCWPSGHVRSDIPGLLETHARPNTSNPSARPNSSHRKWSTNVKMNFVAALLILVSPAFAAQQPTLSAPIPAPILSAHNIFLANGGSDLESVKEFQGADPTNEPYNSTYAALKAWGHWQLVSSPASADLVLVVRLKTQPNDYANGRPVSYSRQVELKIFDAKSRFLLWAFTQPIQKAILKSTGEKNYADAIQGLIIQLKLLTNPATPATP